MSTPPTETGAAPLADGQALNKGLKTGAIGLLAAVVIGVASTAPGYSIAASLGFVTGEAGFQAPAIMWLAFLPMLFIAAAYFYLNRADPDCGTTFTWATRAIGPKSGWIGGWGIFITDLVVMPSLAAITGSYLFLLFGADGLATDTFWVTFVGVAFILAMTLICVIGIELNAKTQFVLLAAELVVLLVFAVAAFVEVIEGQAGTFEPSFEWLNPFALTSTRALTGGLLIAVFLYWGWDTAVSVNEESKDAKRTPGVAALLSTVVLVLTYVVVAVAAQAVRGPGFLTDHAEDVISASGEIVLGSSFDKFLLIAVLTSAAASTQTTILPAARSSLSMAAHRAAPGWFGEVSKRFFTPANSTWFFGILSCVWYVGLTLVSQDVLADSIAAVGLMIAFYYALTGYVCVIYYRKSLLKSVKNFLFVGVAPLLGAILLTYVFAQVTYDAFDDPAGSSESGDVWFGGVSPAWVIGVGLLAIGVPLMLGWRLHAPKFFRRRRDPFPRPEPDGSGPPAPPISDVGLIRDDAPLATAPGGGS